jgi:hypothetical protein
MSSRSASRLAVLLALVAMTFAGCAGAASGTGSEATPTPGPVILPSDAVARVVAHESRLTGIQPFDSGLIGQSSWYTSNGRRGSGRSW